MMPERELKKRSSASRQDEGDVAASAGAPPEAATAARQGERIKADLDDLLDEIDEVLEDNAEEFIRGYVQKGGE